MAATEQVITTEQTAPDESRLFSAKEAARRLGISRATLSRLIQKKQIQFYRIGVKTQFDQKLLDEYMATVRGLPREYQTHRA